MANSPNSTWRDALAAYLAAHARHEDAERGYHRVGRVFEKLVKRGVDDERAYELAGLSLADRRGLQACGEKRVALEALRASLRGESIVTRLMVASAVACADGVPRPANDG